MDRGTDRQRHGASNMKCPGYDVLIIGAGIYGATLACRAAQAGLKTALIDKGDFGGEASANSLKILHGGLRYLQQFDLPRMRESIKARRDAFSALPYLTRPARFIAFTGNNVKRSRLAFGVAGIFNDIISFDRNRGLPASHIIGRTATWSRQDILKCLPDADIDADGALVWSDGIIDNTERFTLAYVMSAKQSGATVMNYTKAISLIKSGSRIEGVNAIDADGNPLELCARFTINATGGWLDGLLPDQSRPRAYVKAYNLVVNRNWFGDFGVGLERGKRNYFFAPWHGGTMIGTEYKLFTGDVDACKLTSQEIEEFISAVNELYPQAGLAINDVVFSHVGILPAAYDKRGNPEPLPSGKIQIIDYRSSHSLDGYMAVSGVKYTTADFRASKVIKLVSKKLQHSIQTEEFPALYGAEKPCDTGMFLRDAGAAGWRPEQETANWIIANYGARYPELIDIAIEREKWRTRLDGSPIPAAAVVHAIRREMAHHATDFIFRRTDLGTFKHPGNETVETVIAIMAEMNNWNRTRMDGERMAVENHYEKLGFRSK